jgi:hypothetical protein
MATRREPISGNKLRTLAARVRRQLGETNQARLDALLPLFETGPASHADCHAAAFPGMSRHEATELFRGFKRLFNAAAKEHGIDLVLVTDSNTRIAPSDRRAWFVLRTPPAKRAAEFSESSIADLDSNAAVPPSAHSTTGRRLAAPGQPVKYFICYARADAQLADPLVESLKALLEPSVRYKHALWQDRCILLGTEWDPAIQEAIKACDFGLLLLSPSFSVSHYITTRELPHFGRGGKPILPVWLKWMDFSRHATHGIDEFQIFALEDERTGKRLPFQKCRGARREEFVEKLFGQIEDRLDAYFAAGGPGAASTSSAAHAVTALGEVWTRDLPDVQVKPLVRRANLHGGEANEQIRRRVGR